MNFIPLNFGRSTPLLVKCQIIIPYRAAFRKGETPGICEHFTIIKMSRPVKAVRTDFFCQAEHKTPTPSGVGVLCSATGSGHVITCTARRWVVSGRLYCFQRPPAEGRREACKPSTDPTSRITNVRINRTAAHRSIFRPAFAEPPCCTQSTAAASRHRQDEKSCRRSGVYLFRCTAAPRLGEKSSQFSGSTGGVPSSAGRKITPPRRTGSAP